MLVLVGLGNPEGKYSENRHNVGFMAVDAVAERYGFGSFVNKFSSHIAKGRVGNHDVVIVKPQTYMNRSGIAVQKVMAFYKVSLNNIFVFHDDLDLELGKVRIKHGGGDGGHNGLKSIDSHIGKGYWRVRIGIDRPLYKEQVKSYVLSDFSDDERGIIDEVNSSIAENIAYLIDGEPNKLMSKLALLRKN